MLIPNTNQPMPAENIKAMIRDDMAPVLASLDEAVAEADELLMRVRTYGKTSTQYLHLLQAIESLRDRAYAMDQKLGSGAAYDP